jgi:hypothetical protein
LYSYLKEVFNSIIFVIYILSSVDQISSQTSFSKYVIAL